MHQYTQKHLKYKCMRQKILIKYKKNNIIEISLIWNADISNSHDGAYL